MKRHSDFHFLNKRITLTDIMPLYPCAKLSSFAVYIGILNTKNDLIVIYRWCDRRLLSYMCQHNCKHLYKYTHTTHVIDEALLQLIHFFYYSSNKSNCWFPLSCLHFTGTLNAILPQGIGCSSCKRYRVITSSLLCGLWLLLLIDICCYGRLVRVSLVSSNIFPLWNVCFNWNIYFAW